MVTGSIVLLYISYAIPVICLLVKGRDNISHGPFWLGKFGLFANIVLLVWTLFTVVMYSFPVVMPVSAGSQSQVSSKFPFATSSLGLLNLYRLHTLHSSASIAFQSDLYNVISTD